MNTDALMSSLKEMIKADIRAELSRLDQKYNEDYKYYNILYSEHETIVRKELQQLADIAAFYKEPVKLK